MERIKLSQDNGLEGGGGGMGAAGTFEWSARRVEMILRIFQPSNGTTNGKPIKRPFCTGFWGQPIGPGRSIIRSIVDGGIINLKLPSFSPWCQ